MSIQHHVPDEELLAYAAGTETDGASLATSCHAAICPACAARVAELEALGGAFLKSAGVAELPSGALAAILARLDGAPQTVDAPPAAPAVPELLRPW